MFRRDALRRLAAVGVAATIAGCGSGTPGSNDAPEPPEGSDGGSSGAPDGLAVSSIDYREGDGGDLVVVVSVSNHDGQSHSATLRATVAVDGEETVETTGVTVAADGSKTVEVPFDVPLADFEADGRVDLKLVSK